ncbi:DUF167 domain-containing protein [Petrachloros mirabilis]|jgi:uncharacterized protein (TIGR00251 family)
MRTTIVQDSTDGAVLTVHVQPKASRTEYAGIHGDALKFRVSAPPVGGAANEELIRFLAQEFSIARSAIRLESGASGRHKRVRLQGVTAERVTARLIEKRKDR